MFNARNLTIAAVAALAITALGFGIGQSSALDDVRPAKDQSRIVGSTTTADPDAPMSHGQVTVVTRTKGDRIADASSCAGHSWPYLPEGCLVSAGGEAPRTPVRTVTVEERATGDSVLLRLPLTQMVSQ